MSSYWAGYSGTGLVLSSSEFDAMLAKYKEKNPDQAKAVDEAVENGEVNCTAFIRSIYAGKSIPDLQETEDDGYAKKVMYFNELTDDIVEGFTIWPFYRQEDMMNVSRKRPDGTWEEAQYHNPMWNESSCYVCWSDKDMTSPKVFEERPYPSYAAFVDEFLDKMRVYLPEDFDWNAHLGRITYACFA